MYTKDDVQVQLLVNVSRASATSAAENKSAVAVAKLRGSGNGEQASERASSVDRRNKGGRITSRRKTGHEIREDWRERESNENTR